MENNDMKTKCLIIGSGPAGYTAAIYAGRAGLNPTLYAGLQMGGQLTQTTDIENFPGFPDGIDANEMMENFRKQAARFDADIRDGVITDVDFNQKPYVVTTDRGEKIEADTIIVATGASAKYLGLPDEEKYRGQGVSACATCDGFFYRKKVVAVVGGGDTACEEATYLANLCSKVYMIIMKKRVEDNPKIEILYETNTLGLYGDNGVEGAHVVYRKGEADEKKYDLPIDGFFLAIGHKPNTDIFRGKLDMDEVGYIKTQGDTPRTNIEGVYAAGDCADPTYRQAVVAAGSGCKAALEAERYLQGK